MLSITIPKPIAEAVIAMLRPYAPDLTATKLEHAICFKLEAEKPEQLLSRKEAAKLLCISIPTIDRMLRDGQLPLRRIRGAVRIPLSAVEALMNGNAAE